MLLKMAFRNIGRNRGRTALSLLAIAVSVMVVVMLKGYVDGMIDNIVNNNVRLLYGHVRVVEKGYAKKEKLLSLNHVIDGAEGEGYQSVLEGIDQVDGVVAAAPRVRFGGLISRTGEPEGVQVVGIDWAREEQVARLGRYIREGRHPEMGQPEVLMGQRLLNKLGLAVGQRFTLVANTAFGSLNGETFTVVGSVVSSLPFLDERSLYMPIDEAQRFVDLGGGVTEIVALAKDERAIPTVANAIQAAVDSQREPGLYVAKPYYEASPMMSQMNLGKVIYNVIYAFIMVLASFVIMNTMWMIVSERTREIGALGALGFTRRQISRLFMYEAASLGFIGSLVGVIVGGSITKILSITGIDFAKAVGGMDPKLLFPTKIYPTFGLRILLFALILGTVVPMLAAYFPARRAQRLNPSEALRSV